MLQRLPAGQLVAVDLDLDEIPVAQFPDRAAGEGLWSDVPDAGAGGDAGEPGVRDDRDVLAPRQVLEGGGELGFRREMAAFWPCWATCNLPSYRSVLLTTDWSGNAFQVITVPEPSGGLLVGLAGAAFLLRRRK